jgi:hypothetical protein
LEKLERFGRKKAAGVRQLIFCGAIYGLRIQLLEGAHGSSPIGHFNESF